MNITQMSVSLQKDVKINLPMDMEQSILKLAVMDMTLNIWE